MTETTKQITVTEHDRPSLLSKFLYFPVLPQPAWNSPNGELFTSIINPPDSSLCCFPMEKGNLFSFAEELLQLFCLASSQQKADSWFCQRGRDLNAKSTGGDAASFQLLQQFALECGTLTPNVCRGNDAPSQQPYCGGKIGYGLVPGPLIFKIGDTPHVTSFFYCVLFLRGPTRHITHTHTADNQESGIVPRLTHKWRHDVAKHLGCD